jgi:hypothetical protein
MRMNFQGETPMFMERYIGGLCPRLNTASTIVVMPTFSTDHKFPHLSKSHKIIFDMGLLAPKPNISQLYTGAYLPSE